MPTVAAFIETEGFTAGRDGDSPVAIAVHSQILPLESIDNNHRNCPIGDGVDERDVTFHYGLDETILHQYVNVEDRSWSFAVADDWPLSGTLAGDPDRHTINIVVSMGFLNVSEDCEEKDGLSDEAEAALCALLADLAIEYDIDPDQTHIFRAHGHLAAVDWDAIMICVNDTINAGPQAADYELLDEFSQFPDGGVADGSTPLIGQDGSVYTLPSLPLLKVTSDFVSDGQVLVSETDTVHSPPATTDYPVTVPDNAILGFLRVKVVADSTGVATNGPTGASVSISVDGQFVAEFGDSAIPSDSHADGTSWQAIIPAPSSGSVSVSLGTSIGFPANFLVYLIGWQVLSVTEA